MKIDYIIVQAGGKGTRLGHLTINKPKALVPINNLPMLFHLFRQFPKAKFVIIADYKANLVLSETFSFPVEEGNYIRLSDGFPCRRRYQGGKFEEIPSSETGVAGLFLFQNKDVLKGVLENGEFVRWLQKKEKEFKTVSLKRTEEFGLLSRIEEQNGGMAGIPVPSI